MTESIILCGVPNIHGSSRFSRESDISLLRGPYEQTCSSSVVRESLNTSTEVSSCKAHWIYHVNAPMLRYESKWVGSYYGKIGSH